MNRVPKSLSSVFDHKKFSRLSRVYHRSGAFLTSADGKKGPNENYAVNPLYYNRNPRNLEFMGIAQKRKGWVFQQPRKDYYHKLILERTNTNTSGYIEHSSGERIVSASTNEWAVKQFLYSSTDVSAAVNVGRVLAQRCLEAGITHVFYDEKPQDAMSEKMQGFLQALRGGEVVLEEPTEYEPDFSPGINYDRPNRVGEPKKWIDDKQLT